MKRFVVLLGMLPALLALLIVSTDSRPAFAETATDFNVYCGLATDGDVFCHGVQVASDISALAHSSSLGNGVEATCAINSDGESACLPGEDLTKVEIGGGTGGGEEWLPTVCGLTVETELVCSDDGTVDISGLGDVLDFALGEYHMCVVLADDGEVMCAGDGHNGQLGDGTIIGKYELVTVLEALTDGSGTYDSDRVLSDAVSVSVGLADSCALLNDGTARCWGSPGTSSANPVGTSQQYGACTGSAVGGACRAIPLCSGATCECDIGSCDGIEDDIADLDTTYHGLCVMIAGGYVRCADNQQGFLGLTGDGTTSVRTALVNVCAQPDCDFLLSGATALRGSASQMCAIMTGGSVTCWGDFLYSGPMAKAQCGLALVPVRMPAFGGPALNDADSDGIHDTCDPCPANASAQSDTDGDHVGNSCDGATNDSDADDDSKSFTNTRQTGACISTAQPVFDDCIERFLGTSPSSCTGTDWPPNTNGLGSGGSIINISDLLMFNSHLNTAIGDANYDQRYDFNADGFVDDIDYDIEISFYGQTKPGGC